MQTERGNVMRKRITDIIILFALLFFSGGEVTFADTLPLGSRTGSMGGAGAAFCRDSAAPYINPAGVALVPGNILSLSASLYTQSGYQIKDFFIPNGIDTSTFGNTHTYEQDYLTSSKFVGFPGSLSYFLHIGDMHVVSFSAIVPTYERMNFNGSITIDFPYASPDAVTMDTAQTYIMERTEYYFGPSYGIKLGDLRLGVSLFTLYRSLLNSAESTSFYTVGSTNFIDSRTTGYGEGATWGLTAILGVQYQLNNFKVGASVTFPTINLAGDYRNSGKYNESSPDDQGVFDEVQIDRGEGSIGYHKPARLRLGLGYEAPRSWSVALDVEYIFATDKLISRDMTYTTTTWVQGGTTTVVSETDTHNSGSTWAVNVQVGGEYFVTSSWAVRAGFFYMPSTVEKFNVVASEILTMKIDRIGGTLGVASIRGFGETTVGISFAYGYGSTVAGDVYSDLTASNYEKVDVNFYQVAVFFSGEVDFSKIGK